MIAKVICVKCKKKIKVDTTKIDGVIKYDRGLAIKSSEMNVGYIFCKYCGKKKKEGGVMYNACFEIPDSAKSKIVAKMV